jgi:hypothetical protein
MFVRVAYTVEHRPTVKTSSVYAKYHLEDQKPEVEIAYATL